MSAAAGGTGGSSQPDFEPGAATDPLPRMVRALGAMGASGASVLLLQAVRTKLLALQLGPEGVGTLALLAAFVGVAVMVVELGAATAGVRDIAAAHERGAQVQRDATRAGLALLVGFTTLLGSGAILAAAGPIAGGMLGDAALAGEVRLCALATAAAVVAAALAAELNGFRRLHEAALVQPVGGVVATAIAVAAFMAGADLIPVLLVAPPVCVAAATLWARRRLPRLARVPLRAVCERASALGRLGSILVVTGGVSTAVALAIRLLVDDELGRAATGTFQAGFALAGMFAGLITAALWTDYVPLVSGASRDPARLGRIVETQVRVVALVTAPAAIAVVAVAPLLVPLLYSSAFAEAADVLRLLVIGEVSHMVHWVVNYVLIAGDARARYALAHVSYNLVLLGATAALLPRAGLEGAAAAHLVAQPLGLLLTLAFVRSATQVRLSRRVLGLVAGLDAALALAAVAALSGGAAGTLVAGALFALTAAYVTISLAAALRAARRAREDLGAAGELPLG